MHSIIGRVAFAGAIPLAHDSISSPTVPCKSGVTPRVAAHTHTRSHTHTHALTHRSHRGVIGVFLYLQVSQGGVGNN